MGIETWYKLSVQVFTFFQIPLFAVRFYSCFYSYIFKNLTIWMYNSDSIFGLGFNWISWVIANILAVKKTHKMWFCPPGIYLHWKKEFIKFYITSSGLADIEDRLIKVKIALTVWCSQLFKANVLQNSVKFQLEIIRHVYFTANVEIA